MSLLIGCSSAPYQKFGYGGGYKEKKLEDGKYDLYSAGNGFSKKESVLENWHRRAKELCPNGYVVESSEEGVVESYGGLPALTVKNTVVTGIISCK